MMLYICIFGVVLVGLTVPVIRLREYQSHNTHTHTQHNASQFEKKQEEMLEQKKMLVAKLTINSFCHCAHLFIQIKVGIYLFVW